MIEMKFRHDPKFMLKYAEKIRLAESRAINNAGTRLQQLVKKEVGKSAMPKPVKRKHPPKDGRKNKTQTTIYTRPSLPGQPPRKRTGTLQKGIWHEHNRNEQTSRVGWRVNAIYGLFHDQGIRYKKAGKQTRPHMMATLEKYRRDITSVAISAFRRAMR